MSEEIEQLKKAAGPYTRYALEARGAFIDIRLRQDAEIQKLYRTLAKAVANVIKNMDLGTSSAMKRKVQLEMFEQQLMDEVDSLKKGLKGILEKYIVQSTGAGSGYSRNITIDLFEKAGVKLSGMNLAYDRVNREAIEACWSRTKDGLHLSDRIWQKGSIVQKKITGILQQSIAIGQDAVTTARLLERYVNTDAKTLVKDYPDFTKRFKGNIAGDLSYEALRLARTETTAAYGEGTIRANRISPSYIGMKWVLSRSHPTYDVCNALATNDEGMGIGVYAPGHEPVYPPHPNCLCDLVGIHEQPEDFVRRLQRWMDDPRDEPGLEKWYKEIYPA